MQRREVPRYRTRADIEFIVPADSDSDRYVIKDPLSMEYFLVGHREFLLLRLLKTPLTLVELRQCYLRQCPGEQRTHEELLAFCQSMLQSQLIVSTSVDGVRRLQGKQQSQAGRWLTSLLSPLVIRLPSMNPTFVFNLLGWWGRLTFSKLFFAVACLTMLITSVAAIGHVDQIVVDARELVKLSLPHYAFAAILALMLCKSWHEIGHGLACRRFGGACHDMGVLLLAFVPCLYCDASDAWTFSKRRHRAIVAMAGIYYELMLATVALLCYLWFAPGFAKIVALYVVVIAGVSSLLVNLNPLVRFDGYYLLSDLWEVPNLHQESRRALWGKMKQWIVGAKNVERPFSRPRWLLALYAMAATLQGVVLVAVILWSVHHFLSDQGLRPLADIIVALSLISLARVIVGIPSSLWKATPPHRRPFAAARAALVATLAFMGIAAASQITIEQTLWSPCRFEHASYVAIAAPLPGTLANCCSYNSTIASGDVVAELVDPQLQLRQMELEASIAAATVQLESEKLLAQRDALRFGHVRALETQLAELRRQLATVESELDSMTLLAPIDGEVLSPPPRTDTLEEDMHFWSGAPLDCANRGCGIESGDLLCIVADGPLQAVILMDEADSGLMRVGDEVHLLLDRWPSHAFEGRVQSVALANSDAGGIPPSQNPVLAAEDSMRRELQPGVAYRVQVSLTESPSIAQHGALGRARVITGRESIAEWIGRAVRQIIQFPQ